MTLSKCFILICTQVSSSISYILYCRSCSFKAQTEHDGVGDDSKQTILEGTAISCEGTYIEHTAFALCALLIQNGCVFVLNFPVSAGQKVVAQFRGARGYSLIENKISMNSLVNLSGNV